MIDPSALLKMFANNATLIRKQSALLSHEDSLVEMSISGQCYNWVLGHIVSARTMMLEYLGEEHPWAFEQRARYRHGNLGVFSAEDPPPFTLPELIATFEESQLRLERGLQNATFETLSQPSGYQNNTIADSIAYLHFHETHHAGQLLYLAQNAGKAGVWVT